MRSYHQYCGLALALDRVGDRWTLLVVRELLVGPQRFSDLVAGLPGVATNLLSERLKALESCGLVERQTLPAPAAAAVYALTPMGSELADSIHALVRWGGRFMKERTRKQAFRPHWLGVALEALLAGRRMPDEPLEIRFELREGAVTLRASAQGVQVIGSEAKASELTVRGPATAILGLAAGELGWTQASALGLETVGPARAVAVWRALLKVPQRLPARRHPSALNSTPAVRLPPPSTQNQSG